MSADYILNKKYYEKTNEDVPMDDAALWVRYRNYYNSASRRLFNFNVF